MGELSNNIKKKYKDDNIFNHIHKNLIGLRDENVKNNNEHLLAILKEGLIPLMKKDEMFNDFYKTIICAGSYYKGTKVGKPDEYDLDLTIQLPLNYNKLKIETDHDKYGYIKIKVEENSKLPKWETYSKDLNKWVDAEGYLDRTKFFRWIQKVLRKSYDQMNKVERFYELNINNKTYVLKEYKESGPAYTIFLKSKDDLNDSNVMSIDLAPCLEFVDIKLHIYKNIPTVIQKFIVVAKELKGEDSNFYWRLSFYEQEKQFLLQKESGKIKPIIRMMKKFRDTINWKKLPSYYIETLCLNELTKNKNDPNFVRQSQTQLFMHMMNKLCEAFQEKYLPFFWHEKHNLFDHIDKIIIGNWANQLKKLIVSVEKNIITDKFAIAELILQSEAPAIKDQVCIPNGTSAPDKDQTSTGLCSISKSSSTFTVYSEDSVDSSADFVKVEFVQDSVSEKVNNHKNLTNIEDRIDVVCKELLEMSKLRSNSNLTKDQLKQLRDACIEFMMPIN